MKRLLPVDEATAAGAAVYSRLTLPFYDLLVMGLENTFVYTVSTSETIAHYNEHVSANHLEVGVGTGYYLDKCTFPTESPQICLVDINRDCLEFTARRLRRHRPRLAQQDILAGVDLGGARFDSVGLNYVLHCLPGSLIDKGVVFENILPLLADEGVVFGTTVLGQHVKHSLSERLMLSLYNRTGILSNGSDTMDDLQSMLSRYFSRVTVRLEGRCIAFFQARR